MDGGDIKIQFETNTTDLSGTVIGNNNILLEDGTEADFLARIYGDVPRGVYFSDGETTFDTGRVTFDSGAPAAAGASTYDSTNFTYDNTSETFDQT